LRFRVIASPVRSRTSHTVHLLGSVDQEEEEGEGARRDGAEREGESLYLLEQLVEGRGIGVAVPAGAAGAAQAFDGIEGLLPFEAADHPAERRGEPADVLMEGNVLAPDGRAGKGGESKGRMSH
jgi:hypothetical protein